MAVLSSRIAVFVVVLAFISAGVGNAQTSRSTVRVVVPYGAGGFIDSVARGYTQVLSEDLKQTLVVENKVGAGGKIGEEFAALAAPDGNTLLISLALRPTLARVTTPEAKDIDILGSFEVIGSLGSTPLLMSVPPSLGVKSFPDLIAKIRAEPGKHSYASTGIGTPSQIAGAMLVKKLGLDIAHVPYRGGAPALPDLMSGVVAWLIDTPTGSGALVESGKVVPIFVTDAQRMKEFPDIPTLREFGHPEFDRMISTVFLMVPAKTPLEILERYHAALLRAQRSEPVRNMLQSLRLSPPVLDMSRSDAKKAAAEQIAVWEQTIKALQ